MKVLMVGPYRQTDGWGHAAKDYLFALNEANVDLYARPIYTTNNHKVAQHYDLFDELEAKYTKDVDVIIQNVLPNLFCRIEGCRNVGLVHTDSTKLQGTPWIGNMNLMDEIWISSEFEKSNLIESGVTCDIKVLPEPCDVNKYMAQGECKVGFNIPKEYYTFYFVGELSTRKNIESLLLAFHREFGIQEPVELVLKLNVPGQPDVYNMLARDFGNLKSEWKLYNTPVDYKNENIIVKYMHENELMAFHRKWDCFVCSSFAEAWCRPAFDAAALGKRVIYNKNTGVSGYLNGREEYLGLDSERIPAVAADRPLSYIYNGWDEWYSINTIELQNAMRKAYEEREMFVPNFNSEDYSYTNIGKKMEELLCKK